jgi:predicted N-acyltransferase
MSGIRRESEIAVIEGIEKIPREDWNALLGADDSPFLDWDWLFPMEQSGSAARATGWAPCHVVVRDKVSRSIIGACPLYLKSHNMGEFVFDHGWAEAAERAGIKYFPRLLAAVPFTPHTGRRFLTRDGYDRADLISLMAHAIATLCADNKLSSVHVNFCESDEAAALGKLGFLERVGYQYHWQNQGFATFDDYLNQLKSKRRYAVRHERAALARQNVNIQVFTGEAIPHHLATPMFEIYRSTIEKLYWGRQYLTEEFFELVFRHCKRHLSLVCAFEHDQLVAATFNLQKAGVFYGRYWGAFSEIKFLHFNVCYYAAIEHCIREGIHRFEPGAGGEYKWLRGFNPALTRSMHLITHQGLRKAVANFLTHERREVEAWITVGHNHSQLKAPAPSNADEDGPT